MNLKARKSKATKEKLSSKEKRKELRGYRKGRENLESSEKQKSMTASLIPTPASQQGKKKLLLLWAFSYTEGFGINASVLYNKL